MAVSFDEPYFDELFEYLSSETSSKKNLYFDLGCEYINNTCLTEASQKILYHHLAAHLITLKNGENEGCASGIVQSSTTDIVSVSLVPPESKSQLSWWLNTTEPGKIVLGLLHKSTLRFSVVGGSKVRAAFRGPSGWRR